MRLWSGIYWTGMCRDNTLAPDSNLNQQWSVKFYMVHFTLLSQVLEQYSEADHESLLPNCSRSFSALIKCSTVKTLVGTVHTPQALVLQSIGDGNQVVTVDSTKCCGMFPWQPQLLQFTAKCLPIYTMTGWRCQHKQQCCHTCLNLTGLYNTI